MHNFFLFQCERNYCVFAFPRYSTNSVTLDCRVSVVSLLERTGVAAGLGPGWELSVLPVERRTKRGPVAAWERGCGLRFRVRQLSQWQMRSRVAFLLPECRWVSCPV